MSFSRRQFIRWAAAATTLTIAARDGRRFVPLLDAADSGFRTDLFPTQKEMWDHETWMAALGPKYTGNTAHTTFVEFLANEMKSYGLSVDRLHYALPRWEARRWEITLAAPDRAPFKVPVTSYFPYSGHTPSAGVTGELVYAGSAPDFKLDGLQGKIALVDFKAGIRNWATEYKSWGVHPETETFPSSVHPARGGVNDLTMFAKAGAVGVIIGWADVSDANAADQYTPFSRPPQGVPGLYVGAKPLAALKSFAGTGAKATVVLEADKTRRRMRLNGQAWTADDGVTIELEQVYSNCPKYIATRHVAAVETAPPVRHAGTDLDATAQELLARADTAFVATRAPGAGVDASHRGGNPGYLRVVDANTLLFPDYTGNSMFNTLGNIAMDPATGLTVVDPVTGTTLYLSGSAEVLWEEGGFPSARSLVKLTVESVVRLDAAAPLRWELERPARNPPVTGPQAAATVRATSNNSSGMGVSRRHVNDTGRSPDDPT